MYDDVFGMERRDSLTKLTLPDLPLEVAPDWDEHLGKAVQLCRLIGLHLEYEARCRGLVDRRAFQPRHLCPEQRVQVITDLYAAVP